MRKTLTAISAAALTAAFATAALADPPREPDYVAPAAGVAAGTAFGLGITEGWWGATAGAALPLTTAGAAAAGGVVGIGSIAFVDAVIQPCAGFHALLDMNEQYCAEMNGYGPRVAAHQVRHSRHYVR
jgi:hypothetical protein